VSLYDLAVLRALAGGDEDFIKEILMTFVNQCDDYFSHFKSNVDAENWEALGRSAHKFNSSVDSIGIIGGKEILKSIEVKCKAEEDLNEIKELVIKITSIANQVKNEIIKEYS
jgi:HPt (histidine-containing phosphotransfer) domain-containing protein